MSNASERTWKSQKWPRREYANPSLLKRPLNHDDDDLDTTPSRKRRAPQTSSAAEQRAALANARIPAGVPARSDMYSHLVARSSIPLIEAQVDAVVNAANNDLAEGGGGAERSFAQRAWRS